VDLVSQADLAVRLVNTAVRPENPAGSPSAREALRTLLADRPFLTGGIAARDVDWLAMVRSELAQVFADAAAGAEAAAVDRLNMLLAAHPLHPVIVRHGDRGWHWHLNDAGSPADRYVATAVAGLAALITRFGPGRLGRCGSAGCERVFIDASSNRSRRYCAEHCTARATVTAISA
jgi:predicted RNA-binding Zn ribbon-like protein